MSTDLAEREHIPDQPETSRSSYLSASDIRLLLELHDHGKTQVEIAQTLKCSQSTVSRTLKAFDADAKSIARHLRAYTDETVEDWREARKVAAKRGDHRPARELLEAAYPELRPVSNHAGTSGGVTVIVAVPNGNNPLPQITVTTPLTLETMASSQPALERGGE